MPINYRQIAFETPLKRQALWVDSWGFWVVAQELTGGERSELLQQCTTVSKVNGKTKSDVNLKKMYPMMVVQSLRIPGPDTMPAKDDPHYKDYPGATDEQGNTLTPAEENAGALIFSMADLPMLNKGSGGTLEKLSRPVSIMSGLREEDIEEKNEVSEESQDDTTETTGSTIG